MVSVCGRGFAELLTGVVRQVQVGDEFRWLKTVPPLLWKLDAVKGMKLCLVGLFSTTSSRDYYHRQRGMTDGSDLRFMLEIDGINRTRYSRQQKQVAFD